MNDKLNDTTGEYQNDSTDEQLNWANGIGEDPSANSDIYIPESESNPNRAGIILVGICVVAVAAVYLFGTKQRPQEASSEQLAAAAQIDIALTRLVGASKKGKGANPLKNTEQMVQAFYEYPGKKQVLLDDLKKNPFSMLASGGAKVDEKQNQEKLEMDLKNKISKMKLQSVVTMTSGNKCLIDGEIYGQGQLIDDCYKIESINVDTVELSSKDFKFVLEM